MAIRTGGQPVSAKMLKVKTKMLCNPYALVDRAKDHKYEWNVSL